MLETSKGKRVVKINQTHHFPKMFQKEAEGLKFLDQSQSFRIPQVLGFGETDSKAFLLLEYIPSGNKPKDFSVNFGRKLALLHQTTSDFFGLDSDNYIGSLVQHNLPKAKDPVVFYLQNRLQPQIDLAQQKGFTFKNLSSFYKNMEDIIPQDKAALVHGDLWAGNYLVSDNSEPVLIDPAVAYAPREMDLAMMKLFGGFEASIFDAYHEVFPLEKEWEKRIPLWQLYYLLVHLNLFGSSYYSSVNQIIQKFG